MQGNAVKLILFVIGGLAILIGGAYVTGVTDGIFPPRNQPVASAPQPPAAPAAGATSSNTAAGGAPASTPPATTGQAPAQPPATPSQAAQIDQGTNGNTAPQAPAPGAVPPQGEEPANTAEKPVPPSFDLVRLSADGSLVVAGSAAPQAAVDVLTGSRILGSDRASEAGEFVAVLDDRLAPGDYTIVLRATNPDGSVLTSLQSAIVSVPPKPDGEVLVMVEQPGEPARILSAPQADKGGAGGSEVASAEKPAEQGAAPAGAPTSTPQTGQPSAGTAQPATASGSNQSAAAAPAANPAGSSDAPSGASSGTASGTGTGDQTAAAAAASGTDQAAAPPASPPSRPNVSIEAVEIEGPMIFVAGKAEPKRKVRVYAGEMLLGEATVSEGGRFLVEARRELPVGDYVIRADVLGPDGTSVIARAAVPFEREPGEQIAAVAPAPATPVVPNTGGANGQPASGANPAPATSASSATAGPDVGSSQAPASMPSATAQTDMQGQTGSASSSGGMATTGGQSGSETTGAKLQATAGSVIIRRGDTLWRISRRVYGMGVRYSTIYLANQDQIEDPDMIWPGQVFALPSETEKGEQADLSRIPGQVQQ